MLQSFHPTPPTSVRLPPSLSTIGTDRQDQPRHETIPSALRLPSERCPVHRRRGARCRPRSRRPQALGAGVLRPPRRGGGRLQHRRRRVRRVLRRRAQPGEGLARPLRGRPRLRLREVRPAEGGQDARQRRRVSPAPGLLRPQSGEERAAPLPRPAQAPRAAPARRALRARRARRRRPDDRREDGLLLPVGRLRGRGARDGPRPGGRPRGADGRPAAGVVSGRRQGRAGVRRVALARVLARPGAVRGARERKGGPDGVVRPPLEDRRLHPLRLAVQGADDARRLPRPRPRPQARRPRVGVRRAEDLLGRARGGVRLRPRAVDLPLDPGQPGRLPARRSATCPTAPRSPTSASGSAPSPRRRSSPRPPSTSRPPPPSRTPSSSPRHRRRSPPPIQPLQPLQPFQPLQPPTTTSPPTPSASASRRRSRSCARRTARPSSAVSRS